MKIILREHVEHLGEPGQTVNVAPGYARNYLLPKRLAMMATPGNMIQLEHQKKTWDARDSKVIGAAEALAARIAAAEVSITMKAGESGTLYGSVTNVDVAQLLADKGVEVDRKRIVMDPIKALGEYEVPVKLHPKVRGQIKIKVLQQAPKA